LLGLAGLDPDEVFVVPWDATVEECRGAGEPLGGSPYDVTLVVVADGSARRGEKAPGHFDERALALDAELVAALEAADAERLLGLDADLCDQLLVHGRAPLQVAAAAMARSGPMRCTGIDVEDPFGVLYVTALLEAVPTAGT
jgi:aromatic ring-opening dioxygenase LigB subunit